jgi:hypothetical protein
MWRFSAKTIVSTRVCSVRSGANVVRTKQSEALLSAHLAAPYFAGQVRT